MRRRSTCWLAMASDLVFESGNRELTHLVIAAAPPTTQQRDMEARVNLAQDAKGTPTTHSTNDALCPTCSGMSAIKAIQSGVPRLARGYRARCAQQAANSEPLRTASRVHRVDNCRRSIRQSHLARTGRRPRLRGSLRISYAIHWQGTTRYSGCTSANRDRDWRRR